MGTPRSHSSTYPIPPRCLLAQLVRRAVRRFFMTFILCSIMAVALADPGTAGARNISATSVAENRLDADLLVSARARDVRRAPTAETLLVLRALARAHKKSAGDPLRDRRLICGRSNTARLTYAPALKSASLRPLQACDSTEKITNHQRTCDRRDRTRSDRRADRLRQARLHFHGLVRQRACPTCGLGCGAGRLVDRAMGGAAQAIDLGSRLVGDGVDNLVRGLRYVFDSRVGIRVGVGIRGCR